jgi:hypothetical protein
MWGDSKMEKMKDDEGVTYVGTVKSEPGNYTYV